MIATDETRDQTPAKSYGRRIRGLATIFAVAGGLVLSGMVLLVVASIIGRAIFLLPIPGDFEIVAIGTGVSIFLFLPYCYVERGNVTVDILADHLPAGGGRVLDMAASLLSCAIAAIFAWRMALGLLDTFSYGDITMIVGLPLWWAYPFAVASFGLVAVAAFHTACFGWSVFDE